MTPPDTRRALIDRPSFLLALGGALVVGANLRWGIGLLAWIAPVPFLRYLRLTAGWRSRLLFVAAMIVTWVTATSKIVTEPLPAAFALLGVAFGLVQAIGYLAADGVRRRAGEVWGTLTFPAAMVVVEWVQHRTTGLASWGAAAYTQLDDLALLQVASLGGIAAVGLLVHGVGASLESLVATGSRGSRAMTGAALALTLAAHVFGAARLDRTTSVTTRVAAIGTDATFDGTRRPSAVERARTVDNLLADTRSAARAGARLAVWTEAAALIMPEEEEAFLERVRAVAAEEHVDIVAAYIVLLREEPLSFANEYRWARSDGTFDHSYFKRHPAPGEPSIVGTGPMTKVDTDFGRLGGALCYDYDFPALAQEHGALGVDLVALPSSDWKGIDPIHTEMAALRAIEQGFSIVRSTRFGLSAGIDRTGRMRARISSFDTSARVMMVELPRDGEVTLYRRFGDVAVIASAAMLVAALVRARRQRTASVVPEASIVAME